jgi:hypothetical protein
MSAQRIKYDAEVSFIHLKAERDDEPGLKREERNRDLAFTDSLIF